MIHNLVRLPVHRTSMIVGIATAILGFIVVLVSVPFMLAFMAMASQMSSQTEFPMPMAGGGMIGMVLLAPLFYAVVGYISTAVFVLIFNLVTPRLGGLPMEFADEESI